MRAKPAVLLAAFLAASVVAQEPPRATEGPRFPSDVEMVVVDVVVTAKGGAPLAGLRAEDFRVTEDGVPQEVGSFEAIDASAGSGAVESAEPRPRVSVNTGLQAMNTRSFVIVFDAVHLAPLTAERAKTAISDFLRFGPREGDTVTIVATGGGSWWMTRASEDMEELRGVVKRLQGRSPANDTPDRITDWEAMRIWQDRDPITLEQVRRRFETYVTGHSAWRKACPSAVRTGSPTRATARSSCPTTRSATARRTSTSARWCPIARRCPASPASSTPSAACAAARR
jgi:hypothetical protein